MNPAPKQPDLSTYSGRFAARLRELREKSGMTVPEFAKRLTSTGRPTTAKTVYNWEASIAEPAFDALPYIAQVFGKSIRSLFPEH